MLEVDNVRVQVRSAPEHVLWRLWDALAYLSPAARDAGFEAPAASPHEPIDAADFHWDGMVRLFRRPKPRQDGSRALPWFEAGLLQRAMSVIASCGSQIQILDFRRRPDINADVPPFWPPRDRPLFRYQEEAVQAAIDAGRGVIVAPPRAGKTVMILELLRRLNLTSVIVAPTVSICHQTRDAALAFGFAKTDVCLLGEDDARPAARVWICTAAKAMSLAPALAKTREVVVCDELHHYTKGGAWGKELHKLFPHVFHWYGASGTYFRSAGDDMALEAFLSGVVFSISSAELKALGRLVPTRVAFCPVAGPAPKRGQDTRKAGVIEHEYRNSLAASAALHLAATGRTTLVMVAQKVQGQKIADLANAHAPKAKARTGEWKYCEFAYRGRFGAGPSDVAVRKKLVKAFLDGTGPRVLIGTSLFGEGVDLPDASALVWARGESAAVSYIQGAYRVSTAAPGKSEALIVDFADRHHPKLLEASCERLGFLHADPIFDVSVLPDPTYLGAWAGSRA